ncbi:MAG: hypothetical protein ACHQVK_01730 [Candidatus Paceibacterales bacterium]
MSNYKKNRFKLILSLALCLLVRLIPFRPPNIEPILAVQMPFSKSLGAYAGFIFGFLSILLYDLVTHMFGVWTFITATTYGVLGVFAFFYFRKKESDRWRYARFAVIGTLFFDAVTGLTIGPIFFHQTFLSSLSGQIPFTLWHLLGNVSFSLILSPAIYNFITKKKQIEIPALINIYHPKTV